MYPAAFGYHRAKTVSDALAFLQSHPDAKCLAGGHSLIPLMKLRFAQPSHLVDLRELSELKAIRVERNELVIGSMVTHWQVQSSPEIRNACGVLTEVAAGIGDPLVRNCGTVGGSLVHADPGADYPAIALAMNATFVCRGPSKERTVKAADWFQSLMTTAIESNELLIEVRIALPAAAHGAAYFKLPDPASRLAMLGVAASIELDDDGKCARAGFGITGAGSMPSRGVSAERVLAGKVPDAEKIAEAAAAILSDVEFEPHRTCTAEDRRELCNVLTKRAATLAAERARDAKAKNQ
jgi:carbon-monoxide dehydrogenase medium subunit